MDMINLFNTNVSDAINKYNAFYQTWIGDSDFTPGGTIVTSDDINCGALCNELEFARIQTMAAVASMTIDTATGSELEAFVTAHIDLPRRGEFESDDTLRRRFKFIVTENTNYRRTTRWAILDAISYFIDDIDSVQIIEPFHNNNLFFEIRFEGEVITELALFLNNNLDQGFLDQNYIGGIGVGTVQSFIAEMVNRIKAAGVDFDVLFITQDSIDKTVDTVIGTVQTYQSVDARVLVIVSDTKTIDATIV